MDRWSRFHSERFHFVWFRSEVLVFARCPVDSFQSGSYRFELFRLWSCLSKSFQFDRYRSESYPCVLKSWYCQWC